MIDAANGLTLTLVTHFASPIQRPTSSPARPRCDATRPVHLHWLAAPVLPGPPAIRRNDRRVGAVVRRIPTRRGQHGPPACGYRENRTGRTGHEHFPGSDRPLHAAPPTPKARPTHFHYGWSGGHKMIAEELPDGRRQIQWGHAARYGNRGTREPSSKRRHLYIAYSGSWTERLRGGVPTAPARPDRDMAQAGCTPRPGAL